MINYLVSEVGRALLPLGVWLNEVKPTEDPLLSRRPLCPGASRWSRFFVPIVGGTEVVPLPPNVLG